MVGNVQKYVYGDEGDGENVDVFGSRVAIKSS